MRAVLWLVWLTGCGVLYEDTVRVRVRDPAAVTATIHPDKPQYADAWIGRDVPLALAVWCPSCVTIKRKTPLANNELVLDGTPTELLTFDGDHVHAKFDFFDRYGPYSSLGRCLSWPCVHHVFAVDFDTPRSNVETIRYEHRVSPRNGGPDTWGLVDGIGFAILGAAFVAMGVYFHERDQPGEGIAIGSGIGMIAVGGALTGLELRERRATDTITTIAP